MSHTGLSPDLLLLSMQFTEQQCFASVLEHQVSTISPLHAPTHILAHLWFTGLEWHTTRSDSTHLLMQYKSTFAPCLPFLPCPFRQWRKGQSPVSRCSKHGPECRPACSICWPSVGHWSELSGGCTGDGTEDYVFRGFQSDV